MYGLINACDEILQETDHWSCFGMLNEDTQQLHTKLCCFVHGPSTTCCLHFASISATRNGLEVGRSFYAGKIGSQSYFEWENSPSSYESWSTQFGGYEEKRGERVWIHNTKVSRRLPREFLICMVKFSQFYLFYYLLSCCCSIRIVSFLVIT